jgi:LysR family transcriptional regulator, regulator of abg operon
MKLNQLRDVLGIAERGSLHAAARHLKVAQPALTRSIRELERELGAALFERRSKGVITTAVGEMFIFRAKAILQEIAHAREEIAQTNCALQGRINICLGLTAHLALLPRALNAFRSRYADVLLDIAEARFPTIEAPLRAGIVDCFVGPLPVAGSLGKEFIVEKLSDQEGEIVCREGHPLAQARSLRDLTEADWVTNSRTITPEEEIGPVFARYGLPVPRVAVQSHSALTMLTVSATRTCSHSCRRELRTPSLEMRSSDALRSRKNYPLRPL